MIKIGEINPTNVIDESGRKIAIATGPRVYFRTELSTSDNDLSKMPNLQLDELIAADVAGSQNVKTFVPRSSGIGSGTRDFGVIKKSKQYGMFYMCIASGQTLRVIKIQTEIREGPSGGEKMPSKVDTGISDPISGLEVRVTTTVRKVFRQDYKDTPFPPDPNLNFSNAGIKDLSVYIAKLFAANSDNVKYTWENPNKPASETSGGTLEIRSFGSNQYFVASIKDSTVDVISIQGKWASDRVKSMLNGRHMETSRLGKSPRKQQHGVDKKENPSGQR